MFKLHEVSGHIVSFSPLQFGVSDAYVTPTSHRFFAAAAKQPPPAALRMR